MSIAAFLVAMVGPMATRLLAALGVSLITLTGLVVTTQALHDQVLTSLGGLPSAALQLGGLFGIWESLGIIFGAITFVITWRSTKGFMGLAKSP